MADEPNLRALEIKQLKRLSDKEKIMLWSIADAIEAETFADALRELHELQAEKQERGGQKFRRMSSLGPGLYGAPAF